MAATQRRRFNAFVARHQLAWDLTMASLALLYIVLGIFEDHPTELLNQTTASTFEDVITAFFLIEFSLRLFAAD